MAFNMDSVFKKFEIDDNIIDDIPFVVSGLEYKNWLVFLYLKVNVTTLQNDYLRAVVEITDRFDELKNNLLTHIISVSHKDTHFMELYNARKKIIRNFPEEDIAIFVRENEVNSDESIFKLTDNTLLEKKAIIKWIVRYGFCDALSYVYPALNDYLRKYIFDCSVLANELTEYDVTILQENI